MLLFFSRLTKFLFMFMFFSSFSPLPQVFSPFPFRINPFFVSIKIIIILSNFPLFIIVLFLVHLNFSFHSIIFLRSSRNSLYFLLLFVLACFFLSFIPPPLLPPPFVSFLLCQLFLPPSFRFLPLRFPSVYPLSRFLHSICTCPPFDSYTGDNERIYIHKRM